MHLIYMASLRTRAGFGAGIWAAGKHRSDIGPWCSCKRVAALLWYLWPWLKRFSDRPKKQSSDKGEEIFEIYEILKSKAKIVQKAWNRRIKEFNNKIRSGSVFELAEVARDLNALQSTKDLSYGEKKMFEKCIGLLVDEIGASRGQTNEEINTEIQGILVTQVKS